MTAHRARGRAYSRPHGQKVADLHEEALSIASTAIAGAPRHRTAYCGGTRRRPERDARPKENAMRKAVLPISMTTLLLIIIILLLVL